MCLLFYRGTRLHVDFWFISQRICHVMLVLCEQLQKVPYPPQELSELMKRKHHQEVTSCSSSCIVPVTYPDLQSTNLCYKPEMDVQRVLLR